MKCVFDKVLECLIESMSNLIDFLEVTTDDDIGISLKRERINEAKYWLDKAKEMGK